MSPEAQQMVKHIAVLIRKPDVVIDESTPLVSSGLIDSMALVDLLLKLEDLTHMRIPHEHDRPDVSDSAASGKAAQVGQSPRSTGRVRILSSYRRFSFLPGSGEAGISA